MQNDGFPQRCGGMGDPRRMPGAVGRIGRDIVLAVQGATGGKEKANCNTDLTHSRGRSISNPQAYLIAEPGWSSICRCNLKLLFSSRLGQSQRQVHALNIFSALWPRSHSFERRGEVLCGTRDPALPQVARPQSTPLKRPPHSAANSRTSTNCSLLTLVER